MRVLFYFFGGLAVILGGLMGMFSGVGMCAAVWGSGILDSALGNPPDRSHPAFWMFMGAMTPGMILGFCGAYFVIYLPLQLRLGIPFSRSDFVIIGPIKRMAFLLIKQTTETEQSGPDNPRPCGTSGTADAKASAPPEASGGI